MILSLRTVSTVIVVASVLNACSAGSEGRDQGDTDNSPPPVIATTSIWADVTSEVFCGSEVPALIPVGADPHTFEPSLRDREMIEDAQLIVSNGSGLEGGVSQMLAANDDAQVIEITSHVDLITSEDEEHETHSDHDHEQPEDDEHDHSAAGAPDPHVWQDPSLVAGVLDVIADSGETFELPNCSDSYEAEIRELDAEITAMLADIPAANRVMVTSHDALAYFADRYDLEIVGTVIPSTNTLAETNAADLAALADVIEQRGVHVIFTEELESTADADRLAERLDVEVVPLVTDALTNDPASDTYIEMMRTNARLIAEALTP